MPYLALGSIASVKAGLSANCGSAQREDEKWMWLTPLGDLTSRSRHGIVLEFRGREWHIMRQGAK